MTVRKLSHFYRYNLRTFPRIKYGSITTDVNKSVKKLVSFRVVVQSTGVPSLKMIDENVPYSHLLTPFIILDGFRIFLSKNKCKRYRL